MGIINKTFPRSSGVRFTASLFMLCCLATIHVGNISSASGDILYVSNGTTVEKIDSDGSFETFASGFRATGGIAVDNSGNVYVADQNGGTGILYRVTPSGVKTTLATDLVSSGFFIPGELEIDQGGNIFSLNNNAPVIS